MVSLRSFVAAGADTPSALDALDTALRSVDSEAQLVFVFYGSLHDDHALQAYLRRRFPVAALLGGTSCGGVMSERQVWGADSIGLLVIHDADGDYGVAAARLGDDPTATAEAVLHAALADARCPGPLPELIWVYQAPGREEAVVEGLRRIVGDRCPIIGGSSADDDVSGKWRQLGPEGVIEDGLVLAVLFPSGGIGYAFQGGYEPAGPNGVITRVAFDATGSDGVVTKSRARRILEIDGQPAAEVYNRWIGGALDGRMEPGTSILAETTMTPLAIDAGEIEGVTQFLLIHPEAVVAGHGLSTFATVEEGTRVHSMRGDRQRLIERAGRVSGEAVARLRDDALGLAGGLIVYCAGCRLAVGEQIVTVPAEVARSFEGAPFLGCFTFGEQGRLMGRNVHGNLMISAITFGR